MHCLDVIKGAGNPITLLEFLPITANHVASSLNHPLGSIVGRKSKGEVEGGACGKLFVASKANPAGGNVPTFRFAARLMNRAVVVDEKGVVKFCPLRLPPLTKEELSKFDFLAH